MSQSVPFRWTDIDSIMYMSESFQKMHTDMVLDFFQK
jgi:hypothetical protein